MKQLIKISIILSFIKLIYPVFASSHVPDSIELIKQWGYPAEQHNIITDDGYILKIFRIPQSPNATNNAGKKPIILLQCPILGTSDHWLMLGPNRSIAMQLADRGYDIWLGNYRGSTYGKNHVSLSPGDYKFWDFSIHEFGIYDNPAIIDFILKFTRQESLIYLGMSMGTTSFFIMLSERPAYNDKIRLFVAFCPVTGFFKKSKKSTDACSFMHTVVNAIDSRGTFEFLPQHPVYKGLGSACLKYNIEDLCFLPMDTWFGRDPYQFDKQRFVETLAYLPGGTSGKVLSHYGQFAKNHIFQQFDYEDREQNIEYYGQPKPPSYNLMNSKVPSLYFSGKNDPLSTAKDAREIMKRVSGSVIAEDVRYEYFNHFDFIFAKDVKKLLYNRVIERIDQFVNGNILELH